MSTTVADHEEQRQQLIPMSILSQGNNVNENDTNIICETDNNLEKSTTSDAQQQTFILRLYSRLRTALISLQFPHLSDNTLRITFLLFITLIGLTSFTVALTIGSSVVQFKQQCPLYASFKFQTIITNGSNWRIKIIPLSERFSPQTTCDFCTFYNVFTFIYCIITGFFFILFNGDQRIMINNDQCLIIPW